MYIGENISFCSEKSMKVTRLVIRLLLSLPCAIALYAMCVTSGYQRLPDTTGDASDICVTHRTWAYLFQDDATYLIDPSSVRVEGQDMNKSSLN